MTVYDRRGTAKRGGERGMGLQTKIDRRLAAGHAHVQGGDLGPHPDLALTDFGCVGARRRECRTAGGAPFESKRLSKKIIFRIMELIAQYILLPPGISQGKWEHGKY